MADCINIGDTDKSGIEPSFRDVANLYRKIARSWGGKTTGKEMRLARSYEGCMVEETIELYKEITKQ
jgi:hypothetical protein